MEAASITNIELLFRSAFFVDFVLAERSDSLAAFPIRLPLSLHLLLFESLMWLQDSRRTLSFICLCRYTSFRVYNLSCSSPLDLVAKSVLRLDVFWPFHLYPEAAHGFKVSMGILQVITNVVPPRSVG